MAVCDLCNVEMHEATTCGLIPIGTVDGFYDPIPYREHGRHRAAAREPKPCHDCGVAPGGYHHHGCDSEECPRCHGQLFICGCAVL